MNLAVTHDRHKVLHLCVGPKTPVSWIACSKTEQVSGWFVHQDHLSGDGMDCLLDG